MSFQSEKCKILPTNVREDFVIDWIAVSIRKPPESPRAFKKWNRVQGIVSSAFSYVKKRGDKRKVQFSSGLLKNVPCPNEILAWYLHCTRFVQPLLSDGLSNFQHLRGCICKFCLDSKGAINSPPKHNNLQGRRRSQASKFFSQLGKSKSSRESRVARLPNERRQRMSKFKIAFFELPLKSWSPPPVSAPFCQRRLMRPNALPY